MKILVTEETGKLGSMVVETLLKCVPANNKILKEELNSIKLQ
jgi:hypothetical protein